MSTLYLAFEKLEIIIYGWNDCVLYWWERFFFAFYATTYY